MVDDMLDILEVEVAYAKPEQQVIIALKVAVGTTAMQAIDQSAILQQFPEINLAQTKIGIFSQVCGFEHVLHAHDRVEIYRPLCNDPKDARRLRAGKK